MNKYAIFIGDAPENYRMKKIEDMYDFLQTTQGGTIPRSNIVGFPNGISDLFLEATIDHCMNEETKNILLYICTKDPVSDSSETIWAGGEEIRKDVIAHYQKLAKDMEIDFQLIYDVCKDIVSEDSLGYESV